MELGFDISDWVDAGFTESQAIEWSGSVWGNTLPKLILSRARSAGYSIELHGVPSASFKESGFDLPEAMRLVAAGFDSESFRGSGFNLENSMELVAAGFNNESGEPPASMRFWGYLGLSAPEVIELRREIEISKSDFTMPFSMRQGQNVEFEFWSEVRSSLEQIHSAGLPVNFLNLKLYFGLSYEKILSVIDSGLDVDLAVKGLNGGFSDKELPMAVRLLKLGLSTQSAWILVRRNIRVKDISRMKSQKISGGQLCSLLEKVTSMSVEAGLNWLEAEFSASEAAKWVCAGVEDVGIAIRRRTAGIKPT